jgi:hypothetical protein
VYDLRHARVSTWLNGGVPPARVAEWAGHSVAVLLKVYAKCIDGQDELASRRIEEARRDPHNGAWIHEIGPAVGAVMRATRRDPIRSGPMPEAARKHAGPRPRSAIARHVRWL